MQAMKKTKMNAKKKQKSPMMNNNKYWKKCFECVHKRWVPKLNRVYEFGPFAIVQRRKKKWFIMFVAIRSIEIVCTHTHSTHKRLGAQCVAMKTTNNRWYRPWNLSRKLNVGTNSDWSGLPKFSFFFLFSAECETLWQIAWSGNYNNLFSLENYSKKNLANFS